MAPKVGPRLKLGGKQRTLRFTNRALMKVQEELGGEGLVETFNHVSLVSMRHIGVMLWGALLHDDPDLDLNDAFELIEPPLNPLIEAITDAVRPWVNIEGADESEAEAEKKGPGPSEG